MKIKYLAILILALSQVACNDQATTPQTEEVVLTLDNLKKSMPSSLLNVDNLIYRDKEGKEVNVIVETVENISTVTHPTGVKYKKQEMLIKLTNNQLKINTSLNISSQLAYGDITQKTYSLTISDNNPYKEALKNTIFINYIESLNDFFPENHTSVQLKSESVHGKEFQNIFKSKTLNNGDIGTRFSKILGIVSLVDSDNNMYIIKEE